MTTPVIIVFERTDIPAAKLILENFLEAEIWVFDPHLIDTLAIAQIPNAKYINCQPKFDQPQFADDMLVEAINIELDIEKILDNNIFTYKYWQHLNWYFLLTNLHGYITLWDSFLKKSLDNYHFHIPVFDRAASYYLPSFLPAILLLERMIIKKIPFDTYLHSTFNETSRLLPVLNESRVDSFDNIFVHIPTCMYDSHFINSELTKLNKNIIIFQSQDWNISSPDFEQTKLEVIQHVSDKIDNSIINEINNKIDEIENYLNIYFKKFLSSEFFIERQVKDIIERYRALLVFLNYLDYNYSTSCPHSIILSSHDAGFHGAFYSFAEKYNIPIIIFPHSKIINMPIETLYINKLITLSHPIQGGIIENIDRNLISNFTIKYPGNICFSYNSVSSLKTIGVVINKFSSDGISFIDTDLYLNGLKVIIEWSIKYNIILKFRLKPGGTCFKWLSENLNIPIINLIENTQIPLIDFALTTDLCLMYDAPTSGAAELLTNSVPLIGVINRKLLPAESAIVSDKIVPSLSISETLELLITFLNSEVELVNFRLNQFSQYFSKFKSGTSLPELILHLK